MARILGVGIAVLDIINTVNDYPKEDTKMRAVAQRLRRGGNAANLLEVLIRIGHHCALAGSLADDTDGHRIRDDLTALGIDTANCKLNEGGHTPVSYVVHNRQNGSRTIVHYRDLPEYAFEDFAQISFSGYDWCHFEGRNIGETARMLHLVNTETSLPCSLEIEKPQPDIERLFEFADLLLFGQDYVNAHLSNPSAFLQKMAAKYPDKYMVCSRGADGAYAMEPGGKVARSPAYPPSEIVDTLGAGDTFNAGMIDALLNGLSLEAALDHACRLAGEKCGIEGFSLPSLSRPGRIADNQ